uniref:Transposase n=1 Tax=Ascaris lumbricoides TaxID=6252 RepID=A0A0M3IJV4_ASCLU
MQRSKCRKDAYSLNCGGKIILVLFLSQIGRNLKKGSQFRRERILNYFLGLTLFYSSRELKMILDELRNVYLQEMSSLYCRLYGIYMQTCLIE